MYTCPQCGAVFEKHPQYIDHWFGCSPAAKAIGTLFGGNVNTEELTLVPSLSSNSNHPRAAEAEWIRTMSQEIKRRSDR